MVVKLFAYGMTERGYAPGAKPKRVSDWQDFETKSKIPSGERVWSIVWYDRLLPAKDLFEYQLVRLPNEDKVMISLCR